MFRISSTKVLILAVLGFNMLQAAPEIERSPRLAEFFQRSFEDRLALSPRWAESLGEKGRHYEWGALSEASAEVEAALLAAQRAELASFDLSQLKAEDRLSCELMALSLDTRIEGLQWRDHQYPLSQMFGDHSSTVTHLLNVHKIEDVSDAKAFIVRLAGLHAFFADLRASLERRAAKGVVAPAFVLPLVIDSARKVIQGRPFDEGPQDCVLLAGFHRKLDALELDEGTKASLLRRAETAMNISVEPAYRALIETLEGQLEVATHDAGVWKLPDGEAFYAYRLRQQTSTDLTPDAIHQIGLENVARIHAEMREIMRTAGFRGTLEAFFEFTRTDPQFFESNTEAGRAAYLAQAQAYVDRMMERVPDYFDRMPKAPLEVRAVEAFREKTASKAFYQRASPDGSRPGYFYANLYDMANMPTYQLEALVYHEGIPGHHFQIAIAQELENVPQLQKHGRHVAFLEGWALYTEELGKDMGFYEDPYSDFGRLAMELWRACRLVVDTGLHAKRWSREEAILYLSDNTPNPEGDCIKAIERYAVMPGQATTYLIGKLKIMELRDRAMQALGDRFDYREFHRVILKDGAVPLSILERKIDEWIASKG